MKKRNCRLLGLLSAMAAAVMVMTFCCPRTTAQEQQNRLLQVFAATGEEDGSVPLENIILDIYKTGQQEVQGKIMTDDDTARLKVRSNLVGTVMTDENGRAEFDFLKAGLPDGVYLITQQENPALSGKPAAYYITIKESLTLNLEMIPEKTPEIQMDIASLQQKSGSFDVGKLHSWIIRSSIPAGISNAREYRITDVLDFRLQYEKGSPKVSLYNRDGQTLILEEVCYFLEEETQNRNGVPVDAFHLALTPDGMTFVAANLGSGEENAELRVHFQAAINRNAAMGDTIPNDAHLDYINSAGVVYHTDSDIPEVHTGGIHILKTDGDGKPLAGSEFMIAREATQAEMETETVTKEVLQVENKDMAVVFLDFLDADMETWKRDTAVTDTEGNASIYGLAYGTYYLIESRAPEGYEVMNQPMQIEIHEFSHLTKRDGRINSSGEIADYTVQVVNTRFAFPNTGGSGTITYSAIGFLLICAACILLLFNRNRRY